MSEKICPHCHMSIYDDEALLCHCCGESLRRASKGLLGKMRYDTPKVLWVLAIGLLAFMFFVVFLIL